MRAAQHVVGHHVVELGRSGIWCEMDIAVGTFTGGKVVLGRIPWDDGTHVTVIAKENRLDRCKYLTAVQIVTGSVIAGEVAVPDADLMDGAFLVAIATRGLSHATRLTVALFIEEGGVSADELQALLARSK